MRSLLTGSPLAIASAILSSSAFHRPSTYPYQGFLSVNGGSSSCFQIFSARSIYSCLGNPTGGESPFRVAAVRITEQPKCGGGIRPSGLLNFVKPPRAGQGAPPPMNPRSPRGLLAATIPPPTP